MSSNINQREKIRVSLPFSEALKLKDVQKERIIVAQSKLIGHIEEWESESLIQLCKAKGGSWINKGAAILYEYAGYIDDYWNLFDKMNSLYASILSSMYDESVNLLYEKISIMCTHFVQLIILFCNWRRLQSTPRQLGGSINIIRNISAELIGKNYSGILMTIIRRYPPQLSNVQLVILCCAVMSYEQFVNIVIPRDGQISSNCSSLFSSIQRFLSLEDQIIPLFTSPRQTLRLPYPPSLLPTWKEMPTEMFTLLEEFSNSISFLVSLEKFLREKVLESFLSAERISLNNNNNGTDISEFPKIVSTSPSNRNRGNGEEIEFVRKRSVTVSAIMDRSKESDLALSDVYRRSTVATSSAPPSSASILPFISKNNKKSPQAMSDVQTSLLVPLNISNRVRLDSDHSFDGVNSISNVSGGQQWINNNNVIHTKSSSPYGSRRNSKVTVMSAFPPNDTSPTSRMITKSSATNVMNVIDVLNILSKPMLSRKETLHTVLREIEVNGISIAELAVRKICIWWRFTIPKIKLLRRILNRNFVREILSDVLDTVVRSSIINQRRKNRLLRNGAASKIQSNFKRYNILVLSERKKVQLQQRVEVAWKYLSRWCRLVLSAVRIFHFIRRFHNKLVAAKRRAKQKKRSNFKQILRFYIIQVLMKEKIENQKRHKQSSAIGIPHDQMICNFFSSNHNDKDIAAICIQKYYRRFIVIRKMEITKKIRNNVLGHKLIFFLCSCIIRRRIAKRKRQFDNSVKIQKIWRGIIARRAVLKLVNAGLILKELWIKHRNYKSLKSRLRRVERPYIVTFHSLRNISEKFLNANNLKIKLSVWWNPLLHIVSQNDFAVIIESKKPQFVFVSQPCKISEDIDMNNFQNKKLTDKVNFRRLSNVTSMVRKSTKDQIIKQIQLDAQTNANNDRKQSLKYQESNESVETPFTEFGIKSNTFIDVVQEAIRRKRDVLTINTTGDTQQEVINTRKESVTPLKPSALLNIHTSIKEVNDSDDEVNSDNSSNDGDKEEEHDITPIRSDRQPSPISIADRQSSTQIDDYNNEVDKTTKNKKIIEIETATDNLKITTETTVPSPSRSNRFTERLRNSISMFGFGGPKPSDSSSSAQLSRKLKCDFDGETVRIPGCHGNSVFKFDILEGERKISSTIFYLSREGQLMYWGGRYFKEVPILQQKRAVQFNQNILTRALQRQSTMKSGSSIEDVGPILDFQIIGGSPSRSRCQWGRVCVKGSGPFKKAINNKVSIGSFFFGKWDRYYLSLDKDGLHFYENKFSTSSFHSIPSKDFFKVVVDIGRPVSKDKGSKSIVEDLRNVILTTFSGDEVYLRFTDTLSTTQWEEALVNTLEYAINESVRKNRSSVTDLAGSVSKLHSK